MARRVHFHVNAGKSEAQKAHAELSAALDALGLEECEHGADADIVVALGGDGTILRAARVHPDRPVVGFNLGGLGYLSGVERKDFKQALAKIAAGRYKISQRTMLSAGLRACAAGSGRGPSETAGGRPESAAPAGAIPARGAAGTAVALNDIVLMRELSGRAAVLDLAVDGHTAARYFADGLVFATPTGSTAYSLSAGGPVLMPDSGAFVVTPMNPHALGMRPIVVGPQVAISVTVRGRDGGRDGKIGVYADGENAFFLDDGESVEIRKAPECALFAELEGYDPYEVLSRKLGWSARGGGR